MEAATAIKPVAKGTKNPSYFVFRKIDGGEGLVCLNESPIFASSRKQAIIAATEHLAAKDQQGTFYVFPVAECKPITRSTRTEVVDDFK